MALGVVEVIWASIAFSRYRGAIPNGRTEAAASEIRQLDSTTPRLGKVSEQPGRLVRRSWSASVADGLEDHVRDRFG